MFAPHFQNFAFHYVGECAIFTETILRMEPVARGLLAPTYLEKSTTSGHNA